MTETRHLNTWIELDGETYRRNLEFFRKLIGHQRELCAVVKANAYGHGVRQILKALGEGSKGEGTGSGLADSFAVHSLDEALELRELGVRREILIMGFTPRARLHEVVAHDFRQVVYDGATLEKLDDVARDRGRRAKVHVKVESGTHRQGVQGEELRELLKQAQSLEGVWVEGMYTHFANIEDTTRHHYARGQMESFFSAVEGAREMGLEVPVVHSACSAAALLFPRTYGDMVRLGISQYGLWPSRETLLSYRRDHPPSKDAGDDEQEAAEPQPVLTWKCRISQLKEVGAGAYVGYGCSYLTTRETRLAVLPIGYSDGYDRALSNVGYVLVKGRRAQVRGRVCMNLVMVDVTDIPNVEVGDEVVLLGAGGDDRIAAEDLASMVGTINYEIVARLRRGIPRILV